VCRPAALAHLLETEPEAVTSEAIDCMANPQALFARMFGDAPLLVGRGPWTPLPAALPGELPGGAQCPAPPPFPRFAHLPSRAFAAGADLPEGALLDALHAASAAEEAAAPGAFAGLTAEDGTGLRALLDALRARHPACPREGLGVLLDCCLGYAPANAWPALELLRVALAHLDAAVFVAEAAGVLAALHALAASPRAPARCAIAAARALARMAAHMPTRLLFLDGLDLVLEAAAALLRRRGDAEPPPAAAAAAEGASPPLAAAAEGANLLLAAVHCGVEAAGAALGRGLPVFDDPEELARWRAGSPVAGGFHARPIFSGAQLAALARGLGAALALPSDGCRHAALVATGSLVMLDLRAAGGAPAGRAVLREGLKARVAEVGALPGAAEDVVQAAHEVMLLLEEAERGNPDCAGGPIA
jgi:hypothetical protein